MTFWLTSRKGDKKEAKTHFFLLLFLTSDKDREKISFLLHFLTSLVKSIGEIKR